MIPHSPERTRVELVWTDAVEQEDVRAEKLEPPCVRTMCGYLLADEDDWVRVATEVTTWESEESYGRTFTVPRCLVGNLRYLDIP